MRPASCSELEEGSACRSLFNESVYPGSKTSAEDSIQTLQSADLTFDAKETRPWLGLLLPGPVTTAWHCFSTEASSCPQIAPVSSRALCRNVR